MGERNRRDREAGFLAKVVTAALIRREGRILIMRRKHETMNGKWEFPGGKLESGESEAACLERELSEELGISGRTGDFFSESLYPYAFGEILLRAYWFIWETGEIQLRVHDRLFWALPGELADVDFSPADRPIARKIQEASCLES